MKTERFVTTLIVLLLGVTGSIVASPTHAEDADGSLYAYVGTYTRSAPGGWSDQAQASAPVGVAVFEVGREDGTFRPIQTVQSENPSFLALHPSKPVLYVINEIDDFQGEPAGSMEAYAIDPNSGKLSLINRQAVGAIPAHLAPDPQGRYVAVANYIGASYQILPIREDGGLAPVSSELRQSGSGPNAARQEAPHPHAVVFDPQGRYIATADLGIDKVEILEVKDGTLQRVSEISSAPGAGPRHVDFHPTGDYLYAINELDATIDTYEYNPKSGEISARLQNVSTVPADFPEHKSTAEIMVHPSGKFLYGSNRRFVDHPQADSIVAYRIDPQSAELTSIGSVTENIAFPRGFNFDPQARWLYALNQKGDSIVQLAIDQNTGVLSPTGLIIETPVPVSLVFYDSAKPSPE